MNQFRVSVKSLSNRPVAESGGSLSHRVVFHIDSTEGALSTDWDGGPVSGEDLKRCLQIQEKGYVPISEPEGWGKHRPDRWQEKIVNQALDRSVSESA